MIKEYIAGHLADGRKVYCGSQLNNPSKKWFYTKEDNGLGSVVRLPLEKGGTVIFENEGEQETDICRWCGRNHETGDCHFVGGTEHSIRRR